MRSLKNAFDDEGKGIRDISIRVRGLLKFSLKTYKKYKWILVGSDARI